MPMLWLDWQEQLDELADVSEAAAAAGTSLNAPVEHCPGWDVGDVVSHLADVQWFWAEVVEQRTTDGDQVRRPTGTPDGIDPVAYLRTQSERLVAALAGIDAGEPLWTWFAPQQHAGFVLRRQLLEATVHAWDIENATTEPYDVSTEVAVLGLEEFVEVMGANLSDETKRSPVALSLEPEDSEWSRTLFGSSNPLLRLQAPASDLLLLVWGRHVASDERVTAALSNINLD